MIFYKEDQRSGLAKNPMKFFVLPVFGLIGLVLLITMLYNEHQIKLYGVKTYARVITLYNQENKKATQRFVTITYACNSGACNSPSYIHDIDDVDRRYSIGDTLIIMYSKQSPTIIEVIGTKLKGKEHLYPGK